MRTNQADRQENRIVHPIPPVWNGESRILILGSFPSVKSRESGFFYGHPRNRFWSVLARLVGEEVPADVNTKREFLLRNRIAVWDVAASCTIAGSSDASIRDVEPNDLTQICGGALIRQIFCNGSTSHRFYQRYQQPVLKREAVCLPSTSPANAAWTLERLTEAWRICLPFLEN